MFPFSEHNPWRFGPGLENDGTFQILGGAGEGKDLLSRCHMMRLDEDSSYGGHWNALDINVVELGRKERG
jgi:hypothetical protein